MTKAERVAEKLQKKFPKIRGISTCEFWNGDAKDLHLGDAAEGGTIDGIQAANIYSWEFDPQGETYEMGVHKKLVAALEAEGYFAEWNDGCTLLAYEM